MKIHNHCMFCQYSICSCQNNYFYCVPIQHIWNGPFQEIFGVLLPKMWFHFAEIFTRGSTLGSKNVVWSILKDLYFHRKWTDPKFALLVQLWLPVSPWWWPKSKKVRSGAGILQTLGYPNMPKLRLYLPSLFGGKYDYFMHYLDYFWKEAGRGDKSESQNQTLTYPFSPTQSLVFFLWHNFASNTFQFRCYLSQRTFQKDLTWIFRFKCFSWCKVFIFEKN